MRLPIGRQAIRPPREGEFSEFGDGKRRARGTAAEPGRDVLLRPEEVHRASGKDDVIPPMLSRHEAMKQQLRAIHLLRPYVEPQRLATIGADGVNATVALKRSTNADCVPSAIPIP